MTPPMTELATLLARAYLRLLAERRQVELAPMAPAPEKGSRKLQIRLDVAGPTKCQLEPGVRP